jgi:uncharacterized membrane protein YsdA (DUF1294 family)
VRYGIAFGLPAALLSVAVYMVLERLIAWPHYYFSWALAASVVTFGYYGLDKWLAKGRDTGARVPELVLNLLTVLGGAPGAWLGRTAFRHKTKLRRHWLMLAILIASSVLEVHVLHTLYSRSLPTA